MWSGVRPRSPRRKPTCLRLVFRRHLVESESPTHIPECSYSWSGGDGFATIEARHARTMSRFD
ncbi:hypothetical protein CMUS01_11864 [Colletotrichum musicola]|uniref:Uncharacterized protein n=1 Tax=Colletotrichum musicola TaxID=2175873 RepID=A0A8H6JTF1_9PEZI|nr:hypothetical protein CMUS01_11864 [Colletotrichum musicola]